MRLCREERGNDREDAVHGRVCTEEKDQHDDGRGRVEENQHSECHAEDAADRERPPVAFENVDQHGFLPQLLPDAEASKDSIEQFFAGHLAGYMPQRRNRSL